MPVEVEIAHTEPGAGVMLKPRRPAERMFKFRGKKLIQNPYSRYGLAATRLLKIVRRRHSR